METRVAVVGIIVEKNDSAEMINEILHEYGRYIVGRMGIPYRERNICIISVVADAPAKRNQRNDGQDRTRGRRKRKDSLFRFDIQRLI